MPRKTLIDTVELAEETLRRLKEYPETYDQKNWFATENEVTYSDVNDPGVMDTFVMSPASWCGTTACLAGHIVSAATDIDMDEVNELLGDRYLEIDEAAMDLMDMNNDAIFMADFTYADVTKWLQLIVDGDDPDTATEMVTGIKY